MLQTISMTVVAIIGVYFIALGMVAIVAPERGKSFLLGFADSHGKHYLELALRFIAGGGLVFYAPRMRYPEIFSAFGWILLVTTLGLLLIPWRWHDKFARKAVPAALQYLKLIGVVSLAIGAGLFYSMLTA
jgi:uncharacterized protein YjeT (DUF2065 family)